MCSSEEALPSPFPPSAFLAPPPPHVGPHTRNTPVGTTPFRPQPLCRKGQELPAAQIDVGGAVVWHLTYLMAPTGVGLLVARACAGGPWRHPSIDGGAAK